MSTLKRAYLYRFYPTDEQKQHLASTFGCCRYVYNWALVLRQQTYQATGKSLSRDQTGRYVISLLVEEQIALLPKKDTHFGIDLGLQRVACPY